MKTCIAVCLAICALVAAVYSTECGHGVDAQTACNDSVGCGAGLELACEHHKCTCATIKQNCLSLAECTNTTCADKLHLHCQDNKCVCTHDP